MEEEEAQLMRVKLVCRKWGIHLGQLAQIIRLHRSRTSRFSCTDTVPKLGLAADVYRLLCEVKHSPYREKQLLLGLSEGKHPVYPAALLYFWRVQDDPEALSGVPDRAWAGL